MTPPHRRRIAITLLRRVIRNRSRRGSQPEDKKLSLGGHLIELKRRLIYSLIVLVVTTSAAFFLAEPVFRVLLRPMGGVEVVFTKVTEMIGAQFMLSIAMGLVVSLPFILYQVVMFLAPALHPREKKYMYIMLPGALLAFAAGAIFSYFVLFPPMLEFLVNFGSGIATPFISIGSYISLITRLLFWMNRRQGLTRRIGPASGITYAA
ncbi:twin-arginine translocase subunit TatC [Chloroflexota bacterium]